MYAEKETIKDSAEACNTKHVQEPKFTTYGLLNSIQCRFGDATKTIESNQYGFQKSNPTGMPNRLKGGLERLSGFDMSSVRVHYNSPEPAKVGALAYAQGSNIHLGRGQEKHLAHEGWHVVQQMQGRVRPSKQMKGGLQLNEDLALEKEADRMGDIAAAGVAASMTRYRYPGTLPVITDYYNPSTVIQRVPARFQQADVDPLLFYSYAKGANREESEDKPWFDLRTHLDTYKAVLVGAHAARKTNLSLIERDIDAWIAAYNLLEEEARTELMRNKKAAIEEIQPLLHLEWAELEDYGSTLNAAAQTLNSIRFKYDYVLEAIADGTKIVRSGESGVYIRKIQTALFELGRLTQARVSGVYDAHTIAAIHSYQEAKVGVATTDKVDTATMMALDGDFTGYAVERRLAATHNAIASATEGTERPVATTPANLLAGTHALNATERAAVSSTIRTGGVAAIGGVLPVFNADIAAGNYKVRVKAATEGIVDAEYAALGHGKAALRADPDNLFGWALIDAIAARAKLLVDAIFGKFSRGVAMMHGVSILDKWEFETANIAASADYANEVAAWRVQKIIQNAQLIRNINAEHGAIQSRPAEEGLINEIIAEIVADKRDELLETHKGWPASSGGGIIHLQRFKPVDVVERRTKLWRLFHTCIHEYIHTLEHSQSKIYSASLGAQEGGFTTREGFTEYFTRVVMSSIVINNDLRALVEGADYDEAHPIAIPARFSYAAATDTAERVASIIGFENLCAAYFLGHIDRLRFN